MLRVNNLNKSYGAQVLFKDLTFSINPKEKIGLVGRNGYGKTTIFHLILGLADPDSGSISIPNNYRIGYLEQHLKFNQETILDECALGLPESEKEALWKVEKILFGLGFSKEDMQKPPSIFSGGFQIRLNLAKLLVSEPDLLLLDEPNNYLDIVAIRWLSDFLKSWKSELMLITHDRSFMDGITTHTMIIHRNRARKVSGDTSKLYQQIAIEEEVHEKTRLNDDKKRKQTEIFISRFRAKARLGSLVQSRVKSLERQKKIEKLEKIETLDFSFNSEPFHAAQMMSAHNITFSYDSQEPYLINHFSVDVGKKERIGVVGKNGKGKSTLLKVFAGELEPVTGNIKKHHNLKTGYFGQTNVLRLNDQKTVLDEILGSNNNVLPQKARNICGTLMFSGDAALKRISVLSGGEKNRVLLGKVLAAPCHLLLLDEPTNHLDMESCEALLDAIDEFDGSVVMVTHNEMFLKRLATKLIVFDKGKVTLYEGGYQDFLDNVGWESELKIPEPEIHAADSQKEYIDRTEQKRIKAELLRERSQTLKPLEKEIKNIEHQIVQLELEIKHNNQLLVQASTENDVQKLIELPKRNSEIRTEIETLFEKLEQTAKSLEQSTQKYKHELEKL